VTLLSVLLAACTVLGAPLQDPEPAQTPPVQEPPAPEPPAPEPEVQEAKTPPPDPVPESPVPESQEPEKVPESDPVPAGTEGEEPPKEQAATDSQDPTTGPGAEATNEGDPPTEAIAETDVEPDPTQPVAPRLFDFLRGASFTAVSDELMRLARTESERLSVVSYGTSRAGRELLVATLGEGEDALTDMNRPALFLVADLDSPGAMGPAPASAGLFVVAEILARAKGEERVRSLLRKAVVHVVLTPDPDALVSSGVAEPAGNGASPVNTDANGAPLPSSAPTGDVVLALDRTGRADLNKNFPVAWTPYVTNGSDALPGPYPLCEPESLALARYLLERTALRGTVLWTRREGLRMDGATQDDLPTLGMADETLQRLGLGQAEADRYRARSILVDEAGSLARFCHASLEGPVLFAPAWEGPELQTVLGPAPAGFVRLVDLVVAMLGELPRIELGEPTVERLRANMWQVEVSLWRGGALAEAGSAEQRGSSPTGVRLTSTGAGVQMVAVRRGTQGPFMSLPLVARAEEAEESTDEPSLGPMVLGAVTVGGTLELRLVVTGDEGSELELVLDSPATGPAMLKVPLQ
jgi:hypothetical protein